jgi:hypothetical protein
MHLDVVDLNIPFTISTKLGRIAQRALRERIVQMWPNTKGQTVVGFGFAGPMLRPFLADSRRVTESDARPARGHALARWSAP